MGLPHFANNFMNAINEFSNRYDFSDYIKYVIINEDNTYLIRSIRIEKIDKILKCLQQI